MCAVDPAVTVSIDLPHPRHRVWDEVSRLEDHVEWMADARSIEFRTPSRSGAGARMVVETRFGPLRTRDVMEVTEWVEGRRIAVRHRGLFTGAGAFTLEDLDGATRFTWSEHIRFPWWLGGPLGALAARPVFRWVWGRNLRRLAARFSAR